MPLRNTACFALLAGALAVAAAGCDRAGSSAAGGAEGPQRASSSPADTADVPNVSVRVVDAAEFAKEVERYRGKVVLADFWATWCAPCKELFPHTVELHKRLAAEGLVVMSVSMDYPSDEAAVKKYLVSQGAEFPNFISREGSGSESFSSFDIEGGAVPCYKLYDREGKLAEVLSAAGGPIDREKLDDAVERLLAAR
jgi:thiol-disulfide isomerase/thioredoxin